MKKLKQTISIENSCNLIGKAKDVFSPIKETITNSLDAIAHRQKLKTNFNPKLTLSIYYKTIKDLFDNEIYLLDFIEIEDNGIGFTKENWERFQKLAETTRGFNNQGTGKIQMFCRFNEVSIDSTFIEDNKWYKLNARLKKTSEYEDRLEEISKQSDTKTIIKMSDFSGDDKECEYFINYLANIDNLKRDILKRFLLRLWIGNTNNTLNLELKTYLDKIEQTSFIYIKDNIPTPDKNENILINTEQAQIINPKKDKGKLQIEWIQTEPKYEIIIQRFKLPSSEIDENGVYICSKDIVVESFKFPGIKRKDANFSGFRYLTCIRGDIFNDPIYVSHTVDKFNFPNKKNIESDIANGNSDLYNQENKYIFWDEIKEKIGQGLSKVYSDIEIIKEERDRDIEKLAIQYGISLDDAEISNIAINDTEEEATVKLFETQAKRFAKENIEIQKTYSEIKELETRKLDPTSEHYRKKFSELSNKLFEKIPQQNKNELTRYIIRRDIVVELLKLTRDKNLEIQKEWAIKKAEGEKIRQDNEGIIHDLIFKRRMKGLPNDLWVLNEEFVHFDCYSDTALENLVINGEKLLMDNIDIEKALSDVGISKDTYTLQRPDIFIFPEEGKCILVELKSPDADLSQFTTQNYKYARLIANYSRKPRHFTQFFGFLIGENIDKVSILPEWRKVPYGNYRINPSTPITTIDDIEATIANIYQEIIPISELAKRAEIRNRSFAEKIGITSYDIEKQKKIDKANQ